MPSKKHAQTLRRHIEKGSAALTDEEALETVELFPAWIVGSVYFLNDRFQYGGELWKCEQPELTASEIYPPGAPGTESLYSKVAKPGDGTHDNPIAYGGNMALEEGKYYTQYGVLYICIRDSIVALYNDLKDLVHNYVEVAE